jgi:tRNA (uracil-5-)-methyltransferase
LLINDISGYLKELELINLVDTYCGSGFIGISLSKHIKKLIGIEISAGNLKMASMNAQLNGLHNSQYILGSSEEIFKDLDPSVINPNETCIVLDPSRKGSSHSYLTQLSQFKPKLIVYVSCNVFTQARDLQYFLHETANGAEYEIRTVKGYDFFPQTKHVESLVVLQLR